MARMSATPKLGWAFAWCSRTSRASASSRVGSWAVAVARYAYGSTMVDQPIGWPTWVMVCTASFGPSWSACGAKESSTAPETSRKKAVAGSPSAKTRSVAWNAIIRAWLALCHQGLSGRRAQALAGVLQAVGDAGRHTLENLVGERGVALEELLEHRGRHPDQAAWLLATHRGGVPVRGSEG